MQISFPWAEKSLKCSKVRGRIRHICKMNYIQVGIWGKYECKKNQWFIGYRC